MKVYIYPPAMLQAATNGTSLTADDLSLLVGGLARPDVLGMTAEIRDATTRIDLADFASRWGLSRYGDDERLALTRLLAAQAGGAVIEMDAGKADPSRDDDK